MKRNFSRALYVLLYLFALGHSQTLWAKDSPPKDIATPEPSTFTVRQIKFDGNTAFTSEELLKHLSLKPGKLFEENQLRFSAGALAGFYRDKGYAEVSVSTAVTHLENRDVDCLFRILEGPIYYVKSIKVEGNHLISENVIKHQIQMKPGDPFSQTRLYEANKSLFLGGYFDMTDISYSSATERSMDIVIKVKERPTRYIKGGLGYGAETKERLSLGYEDRNFLGHARRFDVLGIYSGFLTDPNKYQTILAQTSVAQPYLFDTNYEGQTSVTREWDKRESYDTASTIWRSSVGRRYGKSITANLQYRYQGTRVTDLNAQEAATTSPFTNISAIGPNFTYDNTNDPFLPFFGWRVNASVEKGLTWGVGDLNFYKMTARAGRFETFFNEWTFFTGVQAGFERPDNPANEIPIFERFFLGGANTVRGYEERELGPKDSQDAPVGGDAFGVFNLELRHRLYKKIFGVTFLDGGQLWERTPGTDWPYIRARSLGDLAYGTGVGLRLHTPVGAVRLELGYKLNPPGEGTPSFFQRTAIHFSLGEVF